MNFSKITDDLFIGTTPSVGDYDALRDAGVRLVINMRFMYNPRRDAHNPPLLLLWLRNTSKLNLSAIPAYPFLIMMSLL